MWIEAPFTPAQMQTLNEYQFGVSDHGPGHPFLCGKNDEGHHGTIDGNRGLLIATLSGWRCLYCDHNQIEAFEPFTKTHEGEVRWGDLVIEAVPGKIDTLIDRNRSLSGVLCPPAPTRNNPSHIHQGGAGSDQGDSDQQQVAAA